MEYTIRGSKVAWGISPNLALLFGGENSLPSFLARQHIPGVDIIVDPCAIIVVFVVTGILCKELRRVHLHKDTSHMERMGCLLGLQQSFLHTSALIQW